jgi:nitrogen fixation protein FixH
LVAKTANPRFNFQLLQHIKQQLQMKKYFLQLSAVAVIMLALAACSGSTGNDPKSVAKNFFEAIKTMNIDEAAKYATKESKSMLDLMKMGMSMAPKNMDSLKAELAKQKIEYSEPVINGDEATITVTTDGKEKTDFKLKKEEGLWKVAFDKNSLMKTGMEKMEEHGASDEEMKEAQDALEKLNPDSIKNAMEEANKALDSLKGD